MKVGSGNSDTTEGVMPVWDEAPILKVNGDSSGERGAIYTKTEVVEFILDLIGYTVDQPLHTFRLLEPSFGEGSFLVAAIKRLMKAWRRHSDDRFPERNLSAAILGVELHVDSFIHTHKKVVDLLIEEGIGSKQAKTLAGHWLKQANFLLADIPTKYDFIVGNPPYVRQELISAELIAEYRSRYHTIFDRADLYIPFFERSLNLLSAQGYLGLICTDRWMKNRYGGPLRKLISDYFHLKYYINMVGVNAFETSVSTYPAITVITKQKGRITRTAEKPVITKRALANLSAQLRSVTVNGNSSIVKEIEGVTAGADAWLLDAPEERTLVKKLEMRFPTLEETGCKVRIGVATGSDIAFIGPFEQLNVEPDRKVPLVTTKDLVQNVVAWRGLGVINPFTEEGTLVDLEKYPLLKEYLSRRRPLIEKRHIATKNPKNWYRTIDRIYPEMVRVPKLLIPDMKGNAHIVYENGQFYPHHNLYYITSTNWDLKVLQPILQSGIAQLFVSVYSTKMRGGCLRFQAQYLRKICLPQWEDVDDNIKKDLLCASEKKDIISCNKIVGKLYGLTDLEMDLLF